MEHIPKTRDSPFEIEIQIHGSDIIYEEEPLGFQGFKDFPRSLGYSTEDNLPCEVLQSWLFFGLLTETFGGPSTQYKHEDFIRIDERGRRFASTKMIDKYAFYWLAKRCHEDREAVVHHAKDVDSCIQLANSVMNAIAASLAVQSAEDAWSSTINTLILSLMTLGEYLCNIRQAVIKYKEAEIISIQDIRWRLPLIEKTLEQCWCVGEISMLKKSCNLTSLYYLTTIGRNYVGQKHLKCTERDGCQALQINFSIYKTAHLRNCKCNRRMGPISDEVASIIQSGQIPLVNGGPPSFVDLSASGLRGQSLITYVAISHVWSDGLGNNKGNWLNGCMFKHIQGLVSNLYESTDSPVPFWMDTLCVPQGPKFNNIKPLALAQMANIYRSADKVLILDNSLQAVSCEGMTWVEMSMRAGYSPWATRVWTLQEGRLAREAYFQFKNKPIPVSYLLDSAERNNKYQLLSELFNDCDKQQLLGNASSRRLIQAVATYQPPAQMNEILSRGSPMNALEEDLYQQAIQAVERSAPLEGLKKIWLPWLLETKPFVEESSADEELRNDLYAFMSDPVARHGNGIMRRVRGWGYAAVPAERNKNDPTGDLGYERLYGLFLDVCAGFRGRTTSRSEDENVCLGLLMQAEMGGILAIKPLPWRRKELLVKLNSWNCIRLLLVMFGIDIQRMVGLCHEERTKLLYRQMKKIPVPIIFWNAPRLNSPGWKWAPRSILQKDLEVKMFEPRGHMKRGDVTNRGLIVNLPGFRLRQLFVVHGAPKSTGKICDGDETFLATIVMHAPDEESAEPWRHPYRRSWQRVRLRTVICSNIKNERVSWSSLVKNGTINNLAILIQEEGILVERYMEEDGCSFANHVAVVEKAPSQAACEAEIHCVREYFENETWCIG